MYHKFMTHSFFCWNKGMQEGQRFESVILHSKGKGRHEVFYFYVAFQIIGKYLLFIN